ncbi:hypothetical protein JDV02_001007 [Purpureocillium takamizusanense]|uniref:Uncharacterized protein n=1 Tax=Purpureocillium takamizusanense TaxID=2060973 RepID=A0A9Q8V650_9HYPO|nr:uncharacterized protein JDV02_001007 [Purpureocillium takamizusanense]UNI14373.1 hypothetical protein JDV02_001007 [Purpureocillium takamizusanense]
MRRGPDNCLGWHCLTRPQQIGIIFSIVVFSVVTLVAYMYCLGRARIAQRNRTTIQLPGGRRTARNHDGNTTMAHLPVAQNIPGYPPQVVYYPAVFHLNRHGDQMAPRCVVSLAATPRPYAPIPPMVMYSTAPARPATHQPFRVAPSSTRVEGANVSGPRAYPLDSPPESLRRPRHPTWFQRLSRVLRMPVGTASTVASSTTPGTPVQSPPSAREASRRDSRSATHEVNNIERRDEPSPSPAEPPSSSNTPQDTDGNSLRTNVATVHSDDYEMLDPPSPLAGYPGTSRAPRK